MATRQKKAEQRRRKRQQNRRDQRVSALRYHQRLAGDAYPIGTCVANRGWREGGIASIFVARDVAPGRVTMAAFLVDVWAMGLKDAWGRVDLAASEFRDTLSRQKEQLGTCPLKVETARHLVYGGIQLADRLGFRLPRRYQRWTAILGPLPEGKFPDMSLFLRDGKILLACSAEDLRRRLIGSTPGEFLNRSDVNYILGGDDFTLIDDDADAAQDMLLNLEETMIDQVKRWCFANGQVPHPLLATAIGAMMEATVQNLPEDVDPEAVIESIPKEGREEMIRQTEAFVSATLQHDAEAMNGALSQLRAFLNHTGDPATLIRALESEMDA